MKSTIKINNLVFNEFQNVFLQNFELKSTFLTYKKALDTFTSFLSKKKYTFISSDIIENYKLYLSNELRLTTNTIHTYFTTLSSFFKFLTAKEIINHNPVKNIDYKNTKKTSNLRFISEEDLEKIISPIDDSTLEGMRDIALIRLISISGLKDEDMIKLKTNHISHYRNNWYLYFRSIIETTSKERIKFSESLINALISYLSARQISINAKNHYLFVSHSNRSRNKKLSGRGMSDAIKRRIAESKINTKRRLKITLHTLRKTGIKNAILNIRSQETIDQVYGNKSFKRDLSGVK